MDIVKMAISAGFDELSVVENYSMFLQFAQAVLRQNNDFYNAVVDELVCCHIYSKEHDMNLVRQSKTSSSGTVMLRLIQQYRAMLSHW